MKYNETFSSPEGFPSEEKPLLPGQPRAEHFPPGLVNRSERDGRHGKRSAREQDAHKQQKQEEQFSLADALAQRWKMNKRQLVLLIASVVGLLLVLVGGLSLTYWRKVIAYPPDVSVYRVGKLGDVPLLIGGGGITFPKQSINISYPASERVISVMVKAGDHVTANQPLMQLDASQIKVTIEQALEDMQAAQSFLNTVSYAGAPTNIAEARQSFEIARNKYNALVAQEASPLYHNGTLIAPMNGLVTVVNANPGEEISANSVLLTIMDESMVYIHIKVPLADLGQIQLGQKATVTPAALSALNLSGTVSNIIPQADPQTDTFEVWVSVDNAKSALLPGMSAFARIQATTKALSVPRLSVLNSSGDAAVYVVRGQTAHLQSVQVSGRSVDRIYIGSGLQTGDQLVLVGLDGLEDGQRVHITHTEGP